MILNLKINHLVLKSERVRQSDSAALKAAIERELAAMIEADGPSAMSSAESKLVKSAVTRPSRHFDGKQLARDIALRIYGSVKQ